MRNKSFIQPLFWFIYAVGRFFFTFLKPLVYLISQSLAAEVYGFHLHLYISTQLRSLCSSYGQRCWLPVSKPEFFLGRAFQYRPFSSALYMKSSLFTSSVFFLNLKTKSSAGLVLADIFSLWILSFWILCLALKFLSQPLLALNCVSPPNFLLKMNAFSQRTGPEIGWPCECFCKNHMYTASSALSFSVLLIIFLVELPSTLARPEANFKTHSALFLMSEIVEVPTPYSSSSFFPLLCFFSLLTMFTLSFIVKTTCFLLGTVTSKILKKFFT